MISRACTLLLGTPARTVDRLTSGSRTAVFRVSLCDGRSVVVKLYAHTARRNAITEATAIRAAAGVVPVAKVLGAGVISDGGVTALVTSDLGKRTLGSAAGAGLVPRAQALRDLGGLLARLHRAPVEPAVPRRPFFQDISSLARRCPPDLLDQIAPALGVIADTPDTAPMVWCHGDLHFDNVVLCGTHDTRRLVDFTDATPGRREADVAQALVMTAASTPWDCRALLDAYPLPLADTRLAAWTVLHTVRCWAHAAPGRSRSMWQSRLADLTRETPHLFRTSRPQRSPR